MKKVLKENIHIDVDPATPCYFPFKEEDIIKTCEDIKQQILRHIDDVAQVSIVWENRSVCSFCECDWEVNKDLPDGSNDELMWELGEPLCCIKAQEEWKKLKEATLKTN